MAGAAYLVGSSAQLKPLNTPEYTCLGGRMNGNNTESNRQQKIPVACTYDLMRVYCDNQGTGRAMKTRKNTANGNCNPTITDSTAGVYYDNSNSDSLSAADLFNFQDSQTTNTVTWYWIAGRLVHATDTIALWTSTNIPTALNGTTIYFVPEGIASSKATRTDAEIKVRTAGTLSKFGLHLNSTNAGNSSLVFKVFINGVAGNQVITINSGATAGYYEDASNTDAIAANDLVTIQYVNNSSSGGVPIIDFTQLFFTATSGTKTDHFICGSQARAASATVHYLPPVGGILNLSSTSETERRVVLPFACRLSNFSFRATANTYSASATIVLRKNGADQITLTLGAGVTTVVEDTSSTVLFAAGDDFSVSIVGGTSGSITSSYFGFTLDGSPATAYTQSCLASSSAVGRLSRQTGKPLTAASSSLSSCVRLIGKPLAASSACIASLSRLTGKSLLASCSPAAFLFKQTGKLCLAASSSLASCSASPVVVTTSEFLYAIGTYTMNRGMMRG
jgi:hypothetical protein